MNFLRIKKKEDPFLTDIRFPEFFEDFLEVPMLFTNSFNTGGVAVDVYEEKDRIIAKVELPGVKPEEIKLSIEGDLLKISGEKKHEQEIKRENYYQSQMRYGKFQRIIQLPSDVNAEQTKATYKNGVLKVEMKKSEETKSKEVNIDIE